MLVTYEHVIKLMGEAKLSPEEMGPRLGISGMTIRRWTASDNPKKDLPRAYLPAFIEVTYQLIAEGKILANDPLALGIVASSRSAQVDAAFHVLGLPQSNKNPIDQGPGAVMESLNRIGSDTKRRNEVLKNTKKISAFSEYGQEWRARTTLLLKAIRSKEITNLDKFAAFGALFYLLTPLNFIPDHIPVFGLLDDFAVLEVAMLYYLNRFPKIFDKT